VRTKKQCNTSISDRADEIKRLHEEGFTLQEIGDEYEVTRERIRQILKSLGFAAKDGGRFKKNQKKKSDFLLEQERRYMRLYGCSAKDKKKIYGLVTDKDSPHGKFSTQRSSASNRGIEWNISLKEWFDIWIGSGKWYERGRGKHGYVMARYNDTGAYEIGNVKIIRSIQNQIEYQERRQSKSFQDTLDRMGIERVV